MVDIFLDINVENVFLQLIFNLKNRCGFITLFTSLQASKAKEVVNVRHVVRLMLKPLPKCSARWHT